MTNRVLSNGSDRGETVSDYAESEFTRELIDEIRLDGYRPHAWWSLLSRSWARSLEDIQASPARTRSFWRWAGAIAVSGSSVVLLAWLYYPRELTINILVLWLSWYAGSVFFVLTHLGMVDDKRGIPYDRLLLPNGLSFLRLSLAPLILMPCLITPVQPTTAPIFAMFIAGLAATDLFDGWIARRRGLCTRLGYMLDPLADLAWLSFLAIGLYLADAIPMSLLWLLIVRYPIVLIGVLVLYFARGPAPLYPTAIGRMTTFATSVVLLAIAFKLLLTSGFPETLRIDWAVWCIHFLIATNIIYLVFRGVTWTGSESPAVRTGQL